ncbi:MAG: glutathione peroxidase [Acidobacteria bacterium]|nr:glutathione peroxidase [Acidobacteriota bacterium]
MKIIKITGGVLALGLCAVVGLAYAYGFILDPSPVTPQSEESMYEFTMKDIDGKDVKLETYKGKVVMIVNTASRCGNTPQYEGLQKIYDKYKDKGFIVLGFPANNFMGQEPGSDEEIKEFCTLNYNVSFPMFSKISVKGADQHPFYSFLTHKETNPGFEGDITWNFEKFLADKDGKIIARFTPKTKPEDPKVIEAIEKALGSE